jgi:hypothetical protein
LPRTVGVDGRFYHLLESFQRDHSVQNGKQVKLYIFTYIQEWAVFGLFNSKILRTFTRSRPEVRVQDTGSAGPTTHNLRRSPGPSA